MTLTEYDMTYQKTTKDEYAEQHRQRQEKNLQRRAKELGYEPTKVEAEADSPPVPV